MEKNLNALDLFKFIGALMILMLHVNPFGIDTYAGRALRNIITPLAVPFFFAASGYLWYRQYKNKGRAAGTRAIYKNLRLYILWSILYVPLTVIGWTLYGQLNIYTVLTWIKEILFEGSYLTIWFLNALWSGMLVVFLLLRFLSIEKVFIVSLPFYILSCLLSSWNGAFVQTVAGLWITEQYYSFFETTKNGILFGFPYIALGAFWAEKQGKFNMYLKKIVKKRSVALLVLAASVIIACICWGGGRLRSI